MLRCESAYIGLFCSAASTWVAAIMPCDYDIEIEDRVTNAPTMKDHVQFTTVLLGTFSISKCVIDV